MSRHHDRSSLLVVAGGLGWPLILGLAACSLFYVLIFRGPLDNAFMHRYFATHPVTFSAAAMFFVGLAALLLKLGDVAGQSATLRRIRLDLPPESQATVEDCPRLLDQIDSWSRTLRHSYLGRRLRDALDYVDRRGTAAGLDEELKYLADADAARLHDSYALVRIIIWATPMLGFLGTVVGITQALGDLDAELLATDPKTAMQTLLAGLYIAFDTTALALSLSIVLMFIQFIADQVETQLLAAVDGRASDELAGRFDQHEVVSDPHLIVVQRMSQAVIKTAEQLVEQQTGAWRTTLDQAGQQWGQLFESSAEQVRAALTGSLDQSLKALSDRLAKAERDTDEHMRARWEQWQTALSDNARLLHSQQAEMVRQSELMSRVVEATGEVIKLEQALNENLASLSGAKNFEDTVMSLSATIHLLNARLGHAPERLYVELERTASQGRAA